MIEWYQLRSNALLLRCERNASEFRVNVCVITTTTKCCYHGSPDCDICKRSSVQCRLKDSCRTLNETQWVIALTSALYSVVTDKNFAWCLSSRSAGAGWGSVQHSGNQHSGTTAFYQEIRNKKRPQIVGPRQTIRHIDFQAAWYNSTKYVSCLECVHHVARTSERGVLTLRQSQVRPKLTSTPWESVFSIFIRFTIISVSTHDAKIYSSCVSLDSETGDICSKGLDTYTIGCKI